MPCAYGVLAKYSFSMLLAIRSKARCLSYLDERDKAKVSIHCNAQDPCISNLVSTPRALVLPF